MPRVGAGARALCSHNMFEFVEFGPCYRLAASNLLVSDVIECELAAQNGDALIIVVFSGQALGGSLEEVGDVGRFVFIYFEATLRKRLSNLFKRDLCVFGGGGEQDKVVDKSEVGEEAGVEGEAFVFMEPLLLNWGEEMCSARTKRGPTLRRSLLASSFKRYVSLGGATP